MVCELYLQKSIQAKLPLKVLLTEPNTASFTFNVKNKLPF